MVASPRGPRRGRRPHEGRRQPFIWREALLGLDWLSLRLSPVYLGIGVPRGDGSPVVLVPGLFSVGAHLLEMYLWLRRIGYSPFLSSVGINVACMQVRTQRLENTVVDAHAKTGKPVRLIGHSLGCFVVSAGLVGVPNCSPNMGYKPTEKDVPRVFLSGFGVPCV